MNPATLPAPVIELPLEDIGSDEFFDLDFDETGKGLEGDEIGAGFDFTTYDKSLRLRRRALGLIGLGNVI